MISVVAHINPRLSCWHPVTACEYRRCANRGARTTCGHNGVSNDSSVACSLSGVNESIQSLICWPFQTLMVGDKVMGFGNFPCATHKLMVDFASEVKWLTSAIRSSCSELVIVALHELTMDRILPCDFALCTQQSFLRIKKKSRRFVVQTECCSSSFQKPRRQCASSNPMLG